MSAVELCLGSASSPDGWLPPSKALDLARLAACQLQPRALHTLCCELIFLLTGLADPLFGGHPHAAPAVPAGWASSHCAAWCQGSLWGSTAARREGPHGGCSSAQISGH